MAKPLVLDVTVPTQDLSYPVMVGPGVLQRVGAQLRRDRPRATRAALISDDNVMPLHGQIVWDSLQQAGLQVCPVTIEPGEASKTPQTLVSLVRKLVQVGLSRHDAVVALGGGVVGDVAGLVAATFMRGIGFIQCPTSLLAQVDASVGGKVAVDLPEGKNLLGAFHFPTSVLIEPAVLSTLGDDEIGCGMAEMLKHGALFSVEHFEGLVARAGSFYDRDVSAMTPLIATSVALKAACVSRDPKELASGSKGRVLLNLGHTVGHAIEHASGFSVKHGQAVGLGLRAAARLSARRGWAAPQLEERVVQALSACRLPTDLDRWLGPEHATTLAQALDHDKKRSAATVTYIALEELGSPRVEPLAAAEILDLLRPDSAPC